MTENLQRYVNAQFLYFIVFCAILLDYGYHLIDNQNLPFLLSSPVMVAIFAMAITSFFKWRNIANGYELFACQSLIRMVLNMVQLAIFSLILWTAYFFHAAIAPEYGFALFIFPIYIILVPATFLFIVLTIFYRPFRFATK